MLRSNCCTTPRGLALPMRGSPRKRSAPKPSMPISAATSAQIAPLNLDDQVTLDAVIVDADRAVDLGDGC